MKIARTTEKEIQDLSDILGEVRRLSQLLSGPISRRLSDVNFEEEEMTLFGSDIRTDDPEQCLRDLVRHIASLNWEKVLMNCLVMLDNCTDPNQDTLEHSPEIMEGLELLKEKRNSVTLTEALLAARTYINEPEHQHSQTTFTLIKSKMDAALEGRTPKVFLSLSNGSIHPAFRIGNQTFSLHVFRDKDMDQKEQMNWHANMLRSAFGLERVNNDRDVLRSLFGDNEPIGEMQESKEKEALSAQTNFDNTMMVSLNFPINVTDLGEDAPRKDERYIAESNDIMGMIAFGRTKAEAIDELNKSMKLKILYDLGVPELMFDQAIGTPPTGEEMLHIIESMLFDQMSIGGVFPDTTEKVREIILRAGGPQSWEPSALGFKKETK